MFTERPGVLTNDFFVNLLDLGTTWKPLDPGSHAFAGAKDGSGEKVGVGTRVDLLFGSNSELRALAEVYASDDAAEKFVRDFAAAWGKVTELDRFDLHRCARLRSERHFEGSPPDPIRGRALACARPSARAGPLAQMLVRSNSARCANPARSAPTIGKTRNTQSCAKASVPP